MNLKLKYIIVCSFFLITNISCFYDSQPKIISNDGNLIIESAIDKNITFRVVGKGRIIAGEKDLITLLQGFNFNGKKNSIYPLNQNTEHYDELVNIHDLRNAVIQLNRNVSSILNVTSNLPNRVSRLQQNLRNLNRRVNIIVRKLRANLCNTAPCKNGGYCIPVYDSFQCQCTSSWSGPTCEVDVDECALFKGTDLGCQNGAWCVNTPGSYRCTCANGFGGLHCTEHSTNCLTGPPGTFCGHGICVPAKNDYGYQCICEQGWKTDGINPQCSNDVNECESNQNNCHSSCINLPGSFKCGPCPVGYTGNGLTCRDIDECEQNNGGCSLSPRVDCINTQGSFRCGFCPPGWTGDGRFCTPTASNDCPSNLNVCHDQAKCELVSGVPVCTCKPGWTGSGYGLNGCQRKAGSYCNATNVCKNGGSCVEQNNRAQCVCLPGFDENNYCEILNPCLSNPCRNGGTCHALADSFMCFCPRGTTGTYCTQIVGPGRCGGALTDSEGTLKVNDFQQSMKCVWVLRTDVSKILEVKFTKFILDNSTTCTENWLQIHDGRNSASQIIGRFCGTSLPKGGTIHSSHYQMYMWLRTDNKPGQGRGFELEWKSIDPICGGLTNLTSGKEFGVIKSPGYPGKSPPNRDCAWDFIAPYGKKLMFRFFEVHLGSTMNECDDFIEIVDSNEKTVKICEESLPQPQASLSNKVTINFHTNQNGYDSAFQLHYEVVGGEAKCGGRFTNKEGLIKSPIRDPRFDPNNENPQAKICLYLIQQPIGTKVTLGFTKFELLDLTNCSYHSVEIFDGETEADPLLGRFCGYVAPANVTSTGNSILIKYLVRSVILTSSNDGFEAKYKLNCDQVYREPDLAITSPGYPNPYLTDLDCVYEIYAPLHNIISLRMNQLSLSFEGENCNFETDNIEVFSNFNEKRRYCKTPPSIIFSKSNYLKLIFHSIDNPSSAIGFKATYRFEKLGCGGILDTPNTTISSFDTNYFLYPSCEWIIIAPSNYSISIRFDVFDLGSSDCNNSLSIFLNTTKTDKQFGNKYCKQSIPTTTIYPTNVVTLFLSISGKQSTNIGFTAYYEFIDPSEQCGGNYAGGYGSLKSPNYPSEYPDDVDCIWIINAPLGHQIELIVRNFSLENTTSRCSEDYLEVRNGQSINSSLIGKFCGTNIPSRLISFTNHLYIKFHSDWSLTESGFLIEWEQASTGCGGQLDSYEGSIHSPHYPDIISGVAQCDWTIHAAAGSFIEFNITRFKDDINFCDGNRLQIYDGPNAFYPKMKLDCSDPNGIIKGASTNEKISVRFITSSDDSTSFILDYKAKCMVTTTNVHGIIESPNFPNNYPDNLHCIWRIVSKKSNKINLLFSHLDLEAADQSCIYDTLAVFDLQNNERIKNQTLCRDKPYLITSISNTVEIEFKTDFSNGAKGFRLEYQVNGCGERLTNKFGSLESPNYPYSLNQYCFWVIEANYGKVVELKIDKFYIDPDNRDCKSNTLVISNNLNDSHPIVNTCNGTVQKITSSGRMMYIRFETDAYHSQKYFKATYTFKRAQCGGVVDVDAAYITSPNYPYDYAPNLYCEWYIRVNYYNYVEISFVTFDIENSTNCENDYVEIYSEYEKKPNNLLLKHCGPNLPKLNSFKSKRNELFVVFKTNNATQKSGWKFQSKKLCGRDLVNVTAAALVKNPDDNECVWKLSTEKEGAHYILNIRQMECGCGALGEQDCEDKNGVEVYEGDTLKMKFCKRHPAQIISNGQKLTVVGKTGSFYFTVTTYERMCGGSFWSTKGKFSSPLYPNSYPSDVRCIYSIKAAEGNFVELTFENIDVPETENCNSDYIEVRARTINGKLLGLFCGNVLPSVQKAFEEIYVIFRSSKDSTGTGFLANYRNVHENEITEEIVSNNKGTIRSPSITDVREDPKPYSWRIMAEMGKVIILNLKEYSQGLNVFDGFDETAMSIDLQHSPFTKISLSSVIYISTSNKDIQKFRIDWEIIDKDSVENNDTKCNEILTIDTQTKKNISSSNYPKTYNLDENCEWIIKPKDQATHVEFKLHAADLESFTDCGADYLTVSSSNNLNAWKEELKQCFLPYSSIPHNISIGRPYLKIKFHSDGSLGGIGFTGIAFVGCGGFMTEPIGIIDSDAISFVNISTQECVWNIQLRPGRKIEFNFEFETEGAETDVRCPKSYALIRDGLDADAPIMKPGRICIKDQAPNSIITSSNRAYIKFYFGRKRKFPWKLTYREHAECGGEIHLTAYANSTNISTPNYPNIPNPHSECIWIFIAPVGRTIELKIIDRFDFKINYNCDKVYVELRDGSTNLASQIGKFCENPGVQRSSSNILYMKFMSDVPEPRTGFTASVSISKCGGMFTQYKGNIKSDNYPLPGGYKSNSACEYSIKVPTFYRLNLTLTDIHLPYDKNGNLNETDHLIIYSISETPSQRYEEIVSVLFGNNELKFITVDSNEVMIKFFTYKQNNMYRGFKIKFERVLGRCYKDVQEESGVLIMPRPTGRSTYVACRWKITVPKGRRISAKVTEIRFDTDSFNSTYRPSQKITFYNDFTMYSKIIQVTNVTMDEIKSSDNRMLIKIYGGYKSKLIGVKVEYTSNELSLCPPDISSETKTGEIKLSNDYANINYFCKTSIELNSGETIGYHIKNIQITGNNYMNVQPLRFKTSEFWSFMEFNKNGTNLNVAITAKSHTIEIIQLDNVKIFDLELKYKKHTCGGEINVDIDTILTMDNITSNLINIADYGRIDCAWELKFSKDLNFTGSTNFSKNCNQEYLSIHNGMFASSAEKKLACEVSTFNFTATNRYIYMHYHNEEFSNKSSFLVENKQLAECGGTIKAYYSDKEIHFTKKDYKNDLECVWDFQGKSGFSVAIEFNGRFFIESSNNCEKDYLKIGIMKRDGDYKWFPKYCGRNTPDLINTTSDKIRIIFRSDSDITGDGFSLKFKQTCGGVYDASTNIQNIISPKDWNIYSTALRCNYTVIGKTGSFINVKFTKFDLSTGNLYNTEPCQYAKITAYKLVGFYDTTPTKIGEYCERNQINEIRAKDFITFIYEASLDDGANFAFEYYIESCGGDITKDSVIHTPFDEEGKAYANNMECVWNITAPSDKDISIRFKYFDYERAYNCLYDHVSVYQGSEMKLEKRKALLCGNFSEDPPHVKIIGNQAIIFTKSDEFTGGKGFSAEIGFVRKCDKHIYYSSLNSTYSHVELDYYTSTGYENDLDCHIWYSVDKGYQIEVEFEDFNVLDCSGNDKPNTDKQDPNCKCDYVEVFDSNNIFTKSVGRYCGSQEPTVFQTTGPNLLIRFVTDGSKSGRGFKASITRKLSICGETEIDLDLKKTLVLHSPNYGVADYPSNVFCRWLINSNTSYKIHFDKLDLEPVSQSGKCNDYVQIVDIAESYATYKQNFIYCGNETPADVVFNVYNMIGFSSDTIKTEILFKSNGRDQRTGFQITLHEISVCNRTFSDMSGEILRFKLPVECKLYFEVPKHNYLSFYLPPNYEYYGLPNCTLDIKFYNTENNELLKAICADGLYTSQYVFLKTNKVYIEVKRPATEEKARLDFYYIANTQGVGCGGKVDSVQGLFSSPLYPDNYRNYTNCRWEITVPLNNIISATFQNFDMGSKINCRSDNVQLIEYNQNGEEVVKQQYCGEDSPATYKSDSNKLAVVYKRTVNFDGTGWVLIYNAQQKEKHNGEIMLTN